MIDYLQFPTTSVRKIEDSGEEEECHNLLWLTFRKSGESETENTNPFDSKGHIQYKFGPWA